MTPRPDSASDPALEETDLLISGAIPLAHTGAECGLLHEVFESRADALPAAVAVSTPHGDTTYAALEERANRLARHLRSRGVQRGSVVGVLLPRGPDAYAAILAILKAGAAYVPLDCGHPADRIAYVLADCGASALVTTSPSALRGHAFTGALVCTETDRAAIDAESATRLSRDEVGVGPRDLCYVIYTSGSTGRPKGVMVEHRSVRHLVETEGELFQVRPDDRVYQGFSLSFDASVEEVWLGLRAGATLVPATQEMTSAGPDLGRLLTAARVTVLSCVPTLLQIFADEIPSLRLLIVGGEACPPEVVKRWSRRGRCMVNTYGPTEATVIATSTDLVPDRPVTIGRALPGYRVHLVDDALRPVPAGAVGEICIGGVGVARGYVGMPGATEERFVPDPFAAGDHRDGRLYRTGDLGRLDAAGDIEFLGRSDSQVKIRGFRVELSEIESVLLGCDGVLAAACALREDVPGIQQLVGYVVSDGRELSEEALRAELRERVPAYMVPALLEPIAELPRLVSGKLDRAALPAPRRREESTFSGALPRTATERRVVSLWEDLLRPQRVGLDDHFFLDLGGHSLLVARMVSDLRKDARFTRVAVADVYAQPTARSLAEFLDANAVIADVEPPPAENADSDPDDDRTDRRRVATAGAVQTAALPLVFGFRAMQWVTPYLVFFLLLEQGHPFGASVAWGLASAIAVIPALVLLAVAAKWLLLGRIRPGTHRLWGAYHVRWWFVQGLVGAMPLEELAGTPLLPFVYRLLGARIGRDVHISTDRLAAFDLTTIGDGACIDEHAGLLGYFVADGCLMIGPVEVGRGAFVGTRAVLREDTVLEDGARIEDLSLLPRGGRIPAGATWAGSPARPTEASPQPAPPPVRGPAARVSIAALYVVLVTAVQLLLFGAIAPGVAILVQLDPLADPLVYLAMAPLVGASFVVCFAAEVVLLKWLLVGRTRTGTFPVHGAYYVRNWVVDRLLAASLRHCSQLRATLYVAPWYRALGARFGRGVELSTVGSTSPDLLTIGDGATIADEASLGAARVEAGWMTLAPTRIGTRSFIGNSAVVPGGCDLGDDSLVGVLSLPPREPADAARTGAAWLGSPPMLLPRREFSAHFREERTYAPPLKLRLARGAFELLRVTLPPAGFILVTSAVISSTLAIAGAAGLAAALLCVPLVYTACCVAVLLGVALAKWLVIGRFRSFERPLWTFFVWRLEFVNALYEFLATPLALEALQGTPLLAAYLRMLGVRIGRGVFLHTTGFLEFDLVDVGDGVALNEDCVVQTHLFADRVLKAAPVRIGSGCTVGVDSVVLYDSEMGDGAFLDSLSLVMKGESLAPATAWRGIPAGWRQRTKRSLSEIQSPRRVRREAAASLAG